MRQSRSSATWIAVATCSWILALASGQLVSAVGPAVAAPTATAPLVQQAGDSDDLGKEIYASQCEPCHGSGGRGDGPASRFMETKPRDLTTGRWIYAGQGSLEEIAAVITDGVADTGMEPFEELLTEEEILAAAEYVLKTFAPRQDR